MTARGVQIEYSFRVSPRAKRVTLRVSAPEGLVVVVPKGFRKEDVAGIVEKRRSWIERALSRILPSSALNDCDDPPDSFLFPLTGKILNLAGADIICLIRAHAVEEITPLAWKIADETGLRPDRINIRNQKSLWGSCSARGNISLNQKLLFFEPHLVRYVVLHELCHLRHRNHSADFWSSLQDLDPCCFVHRKDIRAAQWTIPGWAY